MKILLGGVDPWFGRLDNEPIGADHPRHHMARASAYGQGGPRKSTEFISEKILTVFRASI